MPIDPDDDLGGVDMGARFFGPRPVTRAYDEPVVQDDGTPETRKLAGIYDNFPFVSEDFLDPVDKARAALTVKLMSELFRNSAFTAANPAHVQPTVFSNPVDLSSVTTLPAGPSPTWTDLLTFDVPEGRYCRIKGYGFAVRGGAFTYDGSILWRILVGNTAVGTLNNIAEQRGTPVEPREVFFLARDGERIQFQARRTAAGGPDDIEAVLTGWTWRLRNTYEGTQASITAY